MKKTKKILSFLLIGAMLLSLLSVGVYAAAGTQDNPIVIGKTALGEVSYYFCNTEFAEGQTTGVWYTFTAEETGIAQLDCICYDATFENTIDFNATLWVNGTEYKHNDAGVITRPINSYPVNVGDEIVICIEPVAPYAYGYVYANIGFVTGEKSIDQLIKFKSEGGILYVAAGAKLYCQDDSTNGVFAQMGLLVSGESVDGISVTADSKTATDSDADGVVELKLGGSAGSAGSPPVKPLWIIENTSAEDKKLVLTIAADTTHECEYTDENDADCNTCGAMRDVGNTGGCSHEYRYPCDTTCMLCGQPITPAADHRMTYVEAADATCTADGNVAYYTCDECGGCWNNAQGTGRPLKQQAIVIPGGHVYDHDFDENCNNCEEIRHVLNVLTVMGNSVSSEVNGLAIRVDANVDGMQMDGNTAVYDNASVNGFKLVGMGAVVSNDGTVPTLEDVDNSRVLNIPAVYLKSVDADTGLTAYTIRIVNIPEEQKGTVITFQTYFVYEDAVGQQYTVYGEMLATSYDQVA